MPDNRFPSLDSPRPPLGSPGDEEPARVCLPVPLSLFALIDTWARRAPGAVAIAAPGRPPLTYAGLLQQVEDTARKLNSLGLGRNDRVALLLPNGPEMVTAFLAVAAGATAAPLNPDSGATELEALLSGLNVRALIVQSDADSPVAVAARARGIIVIGLPRRMGAEAGLFTLLAEGTSGAGRPEFARAGDQALLLHTSGTTSLPKIVPLTQANLCASARNICSSLQLSPTDRCLNVMPLFHVHGIVGAVLASLAAGGSVVCAPAFRPLDFFGWVEDFRPTWYTAVPTIHQAVARLAAAHQGDFDRYPFRFVRSCSAPLPARVATELESILGAPVVEAYGMTEASHQVTCNPVSPGRRKGGSVGLSSPTGPEVAVIDPEGNLLAPGQQGEIVLRGATVMNGYENNPEANRRAFTHGWFRTGDLGYLDADGYLFLSGRIKEIINRGGEKISPREVEDALLAHPAVAEAVAFPIPHPTLGEEVGAAVVLAKEQSATEAEIRRAALLQLADFKLPHRIAVVADIPRTATGKPQRAGMAERLGLSGPAGSPARPRDGFLPPSTHEERTLAEIWEQLLGVEHVGRIDDFLELGGDSILATLVISRLRDRLGAEISLADFFRVPTVSGLAKLIRGEQAR